MKWLAFYADALGCKDKDEVFDYFINNLKPSHRLWTFFVNWEKVFKNTRRIEVALNTLNYLIDKSNFDDEFRYLISEHPEVVEVIPALLVRDGKNTTRFKILQDFQNKKIVYDDYDFSRTPRTPDEIQKYLSFVKKTGLKELLTSGHIKNLVDYMIGVEAGLDSNGRKNRGGKSMENIVEFFIQDVCQRNGLGWAKQANRDAIKTHFGRDVPVDKSSRRYDFVIDNGAELFLFEVNFYSGGGSKLKSTAGEYRNLFDVLANQHKFIWITDGVGWQTTSRPLRETFDHNDYVLNLSMLEDGVLDKLLEARSR